MSDKEDLEFVLTQELSKKLWKKLFAVEYIVTSLDYWRKKQGKKYTVLQTGDEDFECDCESWYYGSGLVRIQLEGGTSRFLTCKHMRFVLKEKKISFRKIW